MLYFLWMKNAKKMLKFTQTIIHDFNSEDLCYQLTQECINYNNWIYYKKIGIS